MSFVVTDLSGSTLVSLSSQAEVRAWIRENILGFGDSLDDLGVLKYESGVRVGPPIPAAEFMSPTRSPKIVVASQIAGPAGLSGQIVHLRVQRPTAVRRSDLTVLGPTFALIRIPREKSLA